MWRFAQQDQQESRLGEEAGEPRPRPRHVDHRYVRDSFSSRRHEPVSCGVLSIDPEDDGLPLWSFAIYLFIYLFGGAGRLTQDIDDLMADLSIMPPPSAAGVPFGHRASPPHPRIVSRHHCRDSATDPVAFNMVDCTWLVKHWCMGTPWPPRGGWWLVL